MSIYDEYRGKLWYRVTPVSKIPGKEKGNPGYTVKSSILDDYKKGVNVKKVNRTLDEFFLKDKSPGLEMPPMLVY